MLKKWDVTVSLDEGLDATINYFRGVIQKTTGKDYEARIEQIREMTIIREQQEASYRAQLQEEDELIAEFKRNQSS